MTDSENNMANGARKMIKRLDFGVRRMKRPAPVQQSVPTPVEHPAATPVERPTISAAKRPATSETSSIKRPLAQPTASPKPLTSSHGLRMDFAPARSRAPQKAPQATISVSKASIRVNDTSVAKATITKTTMSVPGPQISISSATPRPARSRGSMMDFVRRPSQRAATSKPAVSAPEPLMSDVDLKAALSGFADAAIEEVPRRHHTFARSAQPAIKPAAKPTPTRSAQPAMRPATKSAIRPAANARMDFTSPKVRMDFATPAKSPRRQQELQPAADPYDDFTDDPFGGDGFGDDIDRIEAEIEAEANDFVKEPRPLFEDPLVQLSKAREERSRKLSAEEAQRLKDEARTRAGEAAKRAPYAALYSTKSPFLSSVNVEKRPLSASSYDAPTPRNTKESSNNATAKKAPAKTPHLSHAAKNMKRQLAQDAQEIHRQTMVMSTPEVKSHNTALVIGILLTILLGAGVGALIYLVFFQ